MLHSQFFYVFMIFGNFFLTLKLNKFQISYLHIFIKTQIRQSGARIIFLSALPNDVAKIEQIIHQKKMAGKGWIWLGSDGATSNYFAPNSVLAKTMDGMLGVNPRRGEGALYLKFLAKWMSKDRLTYPGIIHNENVSRRFV